MYIVSETRYFIFLTGSATRAVNIEIPAGAGPGFKITVPFVSVSNDALDLGNIIFLELCAVEALDEPVAAAQVLVTDDEGK